MYIIVVGGGRIGYYLVKALLEEEHEVLLIEKNKTICDTITEEMGSICINGDGCEAATLAEAGTDRADMMVAITGDDEDNLVACQIAKYKYNVPRTIARIRNPKNEALFKKLGIDIAVSSTNIILEQIEEKVPTHPLVHLLSIEDSGQEVVEVKIPPDAPTIGKYIRELTLPGNSKLVLVIRKETKHRVPTLNTIIKAEDRIIALTTSESEEALRNILRGTPVTIDTTNTT